MILKYQKDGVWGFIDNIRQVATKDVDKDRALMQYEEYPQCENDPCMYMDGKPLPENIAISNKVFSIVCTDMADEGINRHAENLIAADSVLLEFPIQAILAYIEDCKEYDAVLLVTNQKAFLMNDKGQTIERLV